MYVYDYLEWFFIGGIFFLVEYNKYVYKIYCLNRENVI